MTARSVEERLSAEVATAEGNLRFQGQLCYIMHAPEGKPTQNSRESRALRFFFFYRKYTRAHLKYWRSSQTITAFHRY